MNAQADAVLGFHDASSPSELRRLVRGALCLSVWRATGSTGGGLKGYPRVGAPRGFKGSCALPAAALWPAAS